VQAAIAEGSRLAVLREMGDQVVFVRSG
jgi:hypothetical protein